MNSDPKDAPAGAPSLSRRKPLRVSADELVRMEPLRSDGSLPTVATPAVGEVNLAAWAGERRDLLRRSLVEAGAILFRGFDVGGVEGFERFIRAVSGELLEYTYGSTPRSHVSGGIYTSTEYPAHQEIPLHNEMSYSRDWPLQIFFLCVQPSREGGETPIADSRRVFGRIDPALRDRMIAHGVLYVRNYGEGLDVPWQKVFQTDDPRRVEAFCREAGISYEWRDGKRLRTREVCQAAERHPVTGDMVWFNQAHLFHVSNLPADTRAQLVETYGEESLPRNAYFGDGARFEDAELEEIRRAYRSEEVSFPWHAGDVLMVDNMLTAHARKPFSGPRRVVVGMAESWRERERPRSGMGR